MSRNERYITDADGTRVGVVLDIAEYRELLEAMKDIEAIRAYAAAKAADDEAIPCDLTRESDKRPGGA